MLGIREESTIHHAFNFGAYQDENVANILGNCLSGRPTEYVITTHEVDIGWMVERLETPSEHIPPRRREPHVGELGNASHFDRTLVCIALPAHWQLKIAIWCQSCRPI